MDEEDDDDDTWRYFRIFICIVLLQVTADLALC